jgi:hypothetical protein
VLGIDNGDDGQVEVRHLASHAIEVPSGARRPSPEKRWRPLP